MTDDEGIPPINVASACKRRGCTVADIRHAYRYAIRGYLVDDMVIYIGPSRSGQLLEIGVSTSTNTIVHCMPARPKYLKGK